MNFNAGPPVPPIHLPPAQPGEAPRVVHHAGGPPVEGMRSADPRFSGLGAGDPTFVNQMGRLNLNGGGGGGPLPHPRGGGVPLSPRNESFRPLDDNARAPFYEAWIFYKAKPEQPGTLPTWKRADKRKMALSQEELSKLVKKRAKKTALNDQYQTLGPLRQEHVDRLIEERRIEHADPRFEWSCAYADVVKQDSKHKNARPGDYETKSMTVIVVRNLKPNVPVETVTSPYRQNPINEAVGAGFPNARATHQAGPRIVEVEPRPATYGPGQAGPWPGNGAGNSTGIPHPPMNSPQAAVPPPYIHQHPQPQIPGQYMSTTHGNPMPQGSMPQGMPQWMPQGMPQGHAGHPHPVPGAFPSPQRVQSGNAPTVEILNGNPRSPAEGAEQFRHARAARPQQPSQPNQHANPAARHQYPSRRRFRNSSGRVEEWLTESSSIEDDESKFFDSDAASSATEDFEEMTVEKTHQPRGSLHHGHGHRHRYPNQYRQENVYRRHARKQPARSSPDDNLYRRRYRSERVDVVPATSRTRALRERITDQPMRGLAASGRSMIVNNHHPRRSRDTLDDDAAQLIVDLERRNREIDRREEHVRQRERDQDDRARKLDERSDGTRYRNPRPSSPLRDYSPRDYRGRGDGYRY